MPAEDSSAWGKLKLRILHILDHSIPLHSGYTFRTLSILRGQRALGWETHHLTTPKQSGCTKDEENIDGWHFYRTSLTAEGRINALSEMRQIVATMKRLADVAERIKPDILHAHSPVLNAIPALRVGRKLGVPVVYEVRAFWEDAAVDHGTHSEWGPRYRAIRSLETFALKRAQHVTTICEGLRRDIVARGIPEARVTVIPNAVDVSAFRSDGVADRVLQAELGLADATVIGFIGSFYAYEGLDLLIDAMPAILAALPEARILLVGGGPQDAELRAQAQRLGIADKVIFMGRVPHDEVQRYYDLIDILAYPRHSMRLTELVTPLKPLEGMAQGRLLVASDVGGHRELIEHGKTGILFQAGSASALAGAVLGLARDRTRWPLIREAGRRFVESERNWTTSVSRYRPVFERLLSRRQAA